MTKTQPKRLTDAQKARIEVLAKTFTAPEIARKLKVNTHQVRWYCYMEGIKCRRAGAPLDGVDLYAQIRKLGSVDAVAEKYGVTRQAVYYRLSKMEEE